MYRYFQLLPPSCIQSRRAFYFSVFRLYLVHPASSVRIVCSEAFKFIGCNPTLRTMIAYSCRANVHCDVFQWLETVATPRICSSFCKVCVASGTLTSRRYFPLNQQKTSCRTLCRFENQSSIFPVRSFISNFPVACTSTCTRY